MTPMLNALRALRGLYGWWLMGLSALMTRVPLKAKPWDILLLFGENGMDVIARNGATASQQDSQYVVLRLSPEQVLERRVQIPRAASDVLEPVLLNQMSRLVPWPQQETSYGFEIIGSANNAPDQLDIRVVATTRTVLDGGLAQARALGFAPAVVDFAAPGAARTGIELLSLVRDPREKTAKRLHRIFLALLIAGLATGCLGFVGSWRSAGEAQEIEARIAAARTRLAALKSLNAESARLAEAVAPLTARKAGEPAVVILLEALSRALPDGAYLTELEMRGGQIRLLGQSGDVTALIGEIEGTPQFEKVEFAAPTTRDAAAGTESFTIAAQATGAAPNRKEDGDAR
ncbi:MULTISPECIES: PilN domain-containing protein [Rhodomicrobium]|uniref:PilN domain-containing protein n=1 Tax=Rhodomicrobium TaxID=1068 RepID=UPI000B4AE031|nr:MULTISPECIES: PilN domain-containing protein [Rhodomicrobium]